MVKPTELRRSSRTRRQQFDSLNQSLLLSGTSGYDDYMISTEANRRLRSRSRRLDERSTRTRVRVKEIEDNTDSEEEDLVDLYSRSKRNRRQSSSGRNSYAFPPPPPTEDSSNPSIPELANGGVVSSTKTSQDQSQSSEAESSGKEEEEEEVANPRKYFLREHKPVAQPFQYERTQKNRYRSRDFTLRRPRRRTSNRSSSPSSSDDGNPPGSPMKHRDGVHHRHNKTQPAADIQPLHVDPSVTFASVGGLKDHVKCLQEMVVFPLLYPEFFTKFHLTPPRGVLFCGPPGTGKTLLARALASECSKGSRKVAFYMRKGADCLNKWVGESERQLRLLFEKAQETRPSIIFFDELDGLAPVRSSRQDQIHSSMVSTLLALMDGIADREDVVVIGATNRVDAIDPALRRPGRFDRELHFELPDRTTRLEILHIATAKWTPKPTEEFLEVLSDKTVGFCGADLKAICAEAALRSLRRRYPQIYDSSDRYQLDFDSIVISETDFDSAMANFASATSRSSNTSVQKIPTHLSSLLHDHFNRLVQLMPLVESCKRFVSGRRIILCANGSFHGQTSHLAPALLYSFDSQPIINLAIPELFQGVHRTPEEVVAELLTKARKSSPCVIYLPIIESWLTAVPASVWATFKSGLSTITPSVPITIVATSHNSYEDLDMEIASMFDPTTEVFQVSTPSGAERHAFFTNLFKEVERLKPPVEPKINQLEKLVILPPPPPKKISPERLRLMEEEEKEIFADLRIFLREMLHKLIIDKKFHIFAEPVDYNDVPDYLEIIANPMDLATMMTLIDQHKYETIDEFLEDIELIKRNALEYNPAKTAEDRIIRHRAHNLVDRAYSLIKGDINPAFDAKCRAAKQAKVQREQEAKDRKASEEAIKKGINGDGNGEIEKENLACGEELESAKQSLTPPIGDQVENGGKKSQSRCKIVAKRKLALAATTTKVAEVEMIHIKEEKEFIINVDIVKLYQMAHRFVANTDGWSLYALESLYFTLMGLIQSHLKESDKSELLQQIQVELDKLEESLAVS